MTTRKPITYADAGVDIEAGDRAVELMRAAVARTHGPQVLAGAGGVAGLFDVSELRGYRRPLLATSTDGVGTKVAIAQAMDKHDTIGIDLVAMVVDDIVVSGARPLVMTDYIATGKVVPERIADIVAGIAAGCAATGTALVGGETAEHPDLLGVNDYDVAGAAVGVVEADDLLGPDRVRAGDVVLGLASSGLHSNGYSLVRRVVRDAGWSFDRHVNELGRTLGEELLEPTRLYTASCLGLVEAGVEVHALSHVTGGGLAANVARVLPVGLDAVIDRSSWPVPPVFDLVRRLGPVPTSAMERTLNLGLGMVVVIPQAQVDVARRELDRLGERSYVIGEVAEAQNIDAWLENDPSASRSDITAGSKGVHGGRVALVASYRWQ